LDDLDAGTAENAKTYAHRLGSLADCIAAHFLKYIHALSASKATVKIHRDESLIPVFFAMTIS